MMDLNYTRDTTSGQEGLEVIPKIQALDSTLPIVVMTAWATIDLAVEAMKRGARDFVPKPWENERLLTIVRTQIELGSALRKGRKVRAGGRKLAVHGRDRQHSAQSTGETVARDRERRVRARRFVENVARERANRFRDELEPGGRSRGRTFPAGFAFSIEHDRDRAAAVARPPRRHHSAGEQFSADARATLSQGTRRVRRDCARPASPTFVSWKRARARSRDRARGADGARVAD